MTYKIRPIEKQLPSARELRTRAEADLVAMFTELFGKRRVHPDDLALARRLLTHEQAEVVVAGLLRDHLGARPDALEEATAARRARVPAVESTPSAESTKRESREPRRARAERGRDRDRDRERERPARAEQARPQPAQRAEPASAEPARTEPASAEPAPKPAEPKPAESTAATSEPTASGEPTTREQAEPARAAEDDPAVAEIYVSVGRRDGAKPSDFQVLLEQSGVAPELTDYVRVRHGHAFVGVKREASERAVSVLNGAMIAGRKAFAELARRRA